MRYLSMLMALTLGNVAVVACTTDTNIASQQGSGAKGGDGQTNPGAAGTAGTATGSAGAPAAVSSHAGASASTPSNGGSSAVAGNGGTSAAVPGSAGAATGGSSALVTSSGGAPATVPSSSSVAGKSSVGGASATTSSAAGGRAAAGASSVGGAAIAGASGLLPVVEWQESNVDPITTPDISDTEYASFIADANTFGLQLAQKVESSNSLTAKNAVFSPNSAQIALAMTYAAAANDTAAAMKTTLRDNLGSAKYHAGCNRMLRELSSRNYTGKDSANQDLRVELTPANSLWAERTISVKTSFLDLLRQNYDVGVARTDFSGQPEAARQAINAWVDDRTHDRIKDLLIPGDVTGQTKFVLVNALYFYANWAELFQKSLTKSTTFHPLQGADVQVNALNSTTSLDYVATGTVEVLKLPYVTRNLWMTLVLPKAGQFESVRAGVTGAWLTGATSGMTSTRVSLSLPKFTVSTVQLDLVAPLKDLGMESAFADSADFSGFASDGGPVRISKVVQKAFIGVDEAGTEAAAATAVVGDGSAIQPEPISVIFDRPFLFFIQDKTGLVLFSGHVVDPTQSS
jgi:serpin B